MKSRGLILVLVAFVLVALMSACGGGGRRPIEPVAPVIEQRLNGELGQELVVSRSQYPGHDHLNVGITAGDLGNSVYVEHSVNNDTPFEFNLAVAADGKTSFNYQIPHESFVTKDRLEGNLSEVKVVNSSGLESRSKTFFPGSVSEEVARDIMREVYEAEGVVNIFNDRDITIDGVTYNADMAGQLRNILGNAKVLFSEKQTLSNNMDTSLIPENRIFFEMEGLKMYQGDVPNFTLAVIDTTLDEEQIRTLQERAFEEFKKYFGDFDGL